MLPRMKKASLAERLLLGQLGIVTDELPDPPASFCSQAMTPIVQAQDRTSRGYGGGHLVPCCPVPWESSQRQGADLGWLRLSGEAVCVAGAGLPVDLSHFAVGPPAGA
jgi:hypothetical protein